MGLRKEQERRKDKVAARAGKSVRTRFGESRAKVMVGCRRGGPDKQGSQMPGQRRWQGRPYGRIC